jgi:hypothetical protein
MKFVQTDMSCERLGWVRLGEVSDAHAQWIMGNGVVIISPHDLQFPSRWYCRV